MKFTKRMRKKLNTIALATKVTTKKNATKLYPWRFIKKMQIDGKNLLNKEGGWMIFRRRLFY